MSRPRARTMSESEEQDRLDRQRDMQQARNDSSAQSNMISAGELKAEMESLMSLRRRSMSQPASLDPDLPAGSMAATSSSQTAASPSTSRPKLSLNTAQVASQPLASTSDKSPTGPTPAETGTLVRRKSSVSGKLPSEHPLPASPSSPSPPIASTSTSSSSSARQPTIAYDPDQPLSAQASDLFWLPASLHPELAPQEFKAFIREQTSPENLARRVSAGSSSFGRGAYSSGRVERRKSTLRGEYKPTSDDGVGDDDGNSSRKLSLSDGNRRKSSNRFLFEELTISDLQRLEQLAARAESEGRTDGEGEGEHLGRVLRRSLSLNPTDLAAAAAEATGTKKDAPLIVPPPGQILRRSARTKIRKAGMAEGPQRFGPSRRQRTASGHAIVEEEGDRSVDSLEEDDSRKTVSSISSSGDDHQFIEVVPVEWTDEPASIVLESPPPPPLQQQQDEDLPTPKLAHSPIFTGPPPTFELTEPTQEEAVEPVVSTASSTAPSPSSPDYDFATHYQQSAARPQYPAPTPVIATPTPPQQQQQQPVLPPQQQYQQELQQEQRIPAQPVKEKKSGWARLGLSRDDDKKRKGKARDTSQSMDEPPASTKEGFFGSLFGKKRNDDAHHHHSHHHQTTAVPVVQPIMPPAPPPPTASGYLGPDGRYRHFYRLPIHVERAVYRLSHIKLANPRRPLYEQVLISNLMFWYLSVINKPSQPQPAAPLPIPVPQPTNESTSTTPSQQTREREQAPPAATQSATTTTSSQKRTGLSKPGPDGRRSSSGRAEMPVRPAQYEAQHRQIDAEYMGVQQQHHQQQQQHVQQQRSDQPTQQKAFVIPSPSSPPSSSYASKEESFQVTSRTSPPQTRSRNSLGSGDDEAIPTTSASGAPMLGSVMPRKRGDSLNSTSTGTASFSSPAFVNAAVNGTDQANARTTSMPQ